MRNFQKNIILPKNELDRLAARVIKKKFLRVFSSKGSFLEGVGKNLIFKDQSINIHSYICIK